MIGTLMGLIEKVAAIHKKTYEEEKAMAFFVPISALNTNSATSTNTVTTTFYPTQGLGLGGAAMGTLGSGSAGSTVYLQAMAQNQANAYANAYGGAPYALPSLIGVMHTVNFIDARGIRWAFEVDAAYVQIMQDISNNHNNLIYNYPSQTSVMPQAHMKMLEGDFSEEEMTEAEGIIAELEGTNGEARPPSRP